MTVKSLANPLVKEIGAVTTRQPQAKGDRQLPAGLRVVSADSHFEVSKDIFVERLPAHLKEKAPRVIFDGCPMLVPTMSLQTTSSDLSGEDGKANGMPTAEDLRRIRTSAVGVGAWDMDVRDRDLDIEGIEKDLLFPHSMLAFVRNPDLELQEHVYRAYNEYLSETCERDPNRYHGVGICSNWWDPARVQGAIRQIVDLGLKAILVPTSNPGKLEDGRILSYGGKEMDGFWSEIAAAGLPLCFHTGENISLGTRGMVGATMLESFAPFRRPFGQLFFGGVFDRHPEIKMVFAEGGLSWVPPALQDSESLLDVHFTSLDYKPQRRPTECWRDQCYATFMNDSLGLSQIAYIGVENAMWSSDYPHNESTYGIGWDSITAVIDSVGREDAAKILGQNAIDVFKLDK